MKNHPFLFRLLIAAAVVAPFAAFFLVLAATVTYEPWGVDPIQRDEYKQKVADIKGRVEALNSEELDTLPRIAIDEVSHDFGLMDPLSMGSHSFIIRNEGNADLILKGGDTTCKCTLVKGAKRLIAPGEQAPIELTWNSGRKKEAYQQKAIIRTNDPLNPEIELTVSGRVRFEIATSEEELYLSNVNPDGEIKREIDIYSQMYDDFDLSKISCSLDQMVWEVSQLESKDLESYDARSGYRIKLRLPLKELDSLISGILQLHVVHEPLVIEDIETEGDEPLPQPEFDTDERSSTELVREIPIRGKLPKRMTVLGKGLEAGVGMELGAIKRGTRIEKKLFVRTRGDQKPEYVDIGAVEPSFVKVSIEPSKSKSGMYVVAIVVPEDAPITIFNTPENRGRFEITSDILAKGRMVVPLLGAVVDD